MDFRNREHQIANVGTTFLGSEDAKFNLQFADFIRVNTYCGTNFLENLPIFMHVSNISNVVVFTHFSMFLVI